MKFEIFLELEFLKHTYLKKMFKKNVYVSQI